jgi:hypothetical protein
MNQVPIERIHIALDRLRPRAPIHMRYPMESRCAFPVSPAVRIMNGESVPDSLSSTNRLHRRMLQFRRVPQE